MPKKGRLNQQDNTELPEESLSLAGRQQKRENEKRDNTVAGNKKISGPNYPAE